MGVTIRYCGVDVSEFVQSNICGGDAKFVLFHKFDDRYYAKGGPFYFVEINVNENNHVWIRAACVWNMTNTVV